MHYKKPIVRQDRRAAWLKRYETGEPMELIARSDHYDIRTVKRHVGQALQEYEAKEARQTIVRSALQRHFKDLTRLAAKLTRVISAGSQVTLDPPDDLLIAGLRQHLPRSPIWSDLKDWNLGLEQFNSGVRGMVDMAVKDGKGNLILFEVKSHIPNANLPESAGAGSKEPSEREIADAICSAMSISGATLEKTATLLDIIRRVEGPGLERPELKHLEQLGGAAKASGDRLKDELSVVVLRRVVPGRCRYCPY